MASYDKSNNCFLSICKLGIGFSEENLDLITKKIMKLKISNQPSNYIIPKSLKPNYIFKPLDVWEVGYDSFSISSNYSIGRGIIDEEKPLDGLSLRFPRFYRFRPDKSIENSNSPEEIISLFNKNINL